MLTNVLPQVANFGILATHLGIQELPHQVEVSVGVEKAKERVLRRAKAKEGRAGLPVLEAEALRVCRLLVEELEAQEAEEILLSGKDPVPTSCRPLNRELNAHGLQKRTKKNAER